MECAGWATLLMYVLTPYNVHFGVRKRELQGVRVGSVRAKERPYNVHFDPSKFPYMYTLEPHINVHINYMYTYKYIYKFHLHFIRNI